MPTGVAATLAPVCSLRWSAGDDSARPIELDVEEKTRRAGTTDKVDLLVAHGQGDVDARDAGRVREVIDEGAHFPYRPLEGDREVHDRESGQAREVEIGGVDGGRHAAAVGTVDVIAN